MSRIAGLLFWLLPVWLAAGMSPIQMPPASYRSDSFPGFHLEDCKILSFDRIGGEKFFGISALAYDADTGILYMLSDRSRLFAFALGIEDGKIKSLRPLWGRRLRDRYGHKYFLKKSDSEGMTLVKTGDRKVLLISFEHDPRVVAFDLKGRAVGEKVYKRVADLRRRMRMTQLPEILRRKREYRSGNKMLESVAYSEKYGMLTAPEYPLRHSRAGLHGIYTRKGRLCYVRPHGKDLAITELEMMDRDSVLALQRGVMLGKHLRITLQLLEIDLSQRSGGICKSRVRLHASTREGWALDNFEGLTPLGQGRYLMVSDDNDNFFQQTILVLFRLD